MSHFPNRRISQRFLTQILESPQLISTIQNLQPAALARLIKQIGLEDSGEIISLATSEQLVQVFDEDLWQSSRPGEEEVFDSRRFGVWLEILLEAGSQAAAQRLSEMDEDFLAFAISQQILVLDTEALMAQGIDNLSDKAAEASLNYELNQYWLISRNPESWDATLSALIALDTEHSDLLNRILERCCFFSSEYIDDNGGLYQVLTLEDQLASDVAFAREKRREKKGYVSPQAAKAFLTLARGSMDAEDHLSESYLKELKPAGGDREITLPDHLSEEGQISERASSGARYSLLRALLVSLKAKDEKGYFRSMAEFTYLANVLVAGVQFRNRTLRPTEAADLVMAACNLGLESLSSENLVLLFRKGWGILIEDVSLPVARSLFDFLIVCQSTRPRDAWNGSQMKSLTDLIKRQIVERTPWKVGDQMDTLLLLLPPADVQILTDLLDECPSFDRTFFSNQDEIHEAKARCLEIFRTHFR